MWHWIINSKGTSSTEDLESLCNHIVRYVSFVLLTIGRWDRQRRYKVLVSQSAIHLAGRLVTRVTGKSIWFQMLGAKNIAVLFCKKNKRELSDFC
jgi:hypothetical protein